MKLTSEKIEEVFFPLLQHEVRIRIGKKTLRNGKLLLISQKGAYISFVLANPNNIPKIYEIPYPFVYTYDENLKCVTLDYTINSLCNSNSDSIEIIKKHTPEKRNRFYDTVVSVNVV
jgi:hypothetical protein